MPTPEAPSPSLAENGRYVADLAKFLVKHVVLARAGAVVRRTAGAEASR